MSTKAKSEMPQTHRDSLVNLKITQFPPTGRALDGGAFGWGFETKNFRVVIYGPPEADTIAVKLAAERLAEQDKHRRKKVRSSFGVAQEIPEDVIIAKNNRKELLEPVREKKEKKLHHGDHPPAHVHVIQLRPQETEHSKKKKNKKIVYENIQRESRYELIERENGVHTARLIAPTVKEDGSMSKRAEQSARTMIDSAHDAEIQELLDATAGKLIGCWRELYAAVNYTQDQIEKNRALQEGYDSHVTREVELPGIHVKRLFLRRPENSDRVAYYESGDRKPSLRVIFPPENEGGMVRSS
jgi:hypothetical protein